MKKIDCDAYKNLPAKYGYAETEFEFVEVDKTKFPAGGGGYRYEPSSETKDMVVKNKKTGKNKIYPLLDAMQGVSWIDEFEDDLKRGFFN